MNWSRSSGRPSTGRLPALSKAPLAALALALMAFAFPSIAAAAPENLTPPHATPTVPRVGVTESTTFGSWSSKPTTIAYQWRRCNPSTGVCKDIAEATKATYVPTTSVVGYTLVVNVTVTNKEGTGEALSNTTHPVLSATAAPAWRIGGKTLSELGISKESIQSSTGAFSFEVSNGATIACKSSSGSGTISGVDEGTLNVTPEGCEYVGHPSCSVVEMPVTAQVKLILVGGYVYEKFTAPAGTVMTLKLAGSDCAWFGAIQVNIGGSYAAKIGEESEAVTLQATSNKLIEQATETQLSVLGAAGYISAASNQSLSGASIGKELGAW